MRPTKYRSVDEVKKEELQGIKGALVLPRTRIDRLVAAKVVQVKDREVWYKNVPVYQDNAKRPLRDDIASKMLNVKDL